MQAANSLKELAPQGREGSQKDKGDTQKGATYDPRLMPGTKHCQCPVCGEYFTTEKNYEMHRQTVSRKPYRRVCVNPGSVVNGRKKARLRLNSRGLWASAEGAYLPKGKDDD